MRLSKNFTLEEMIRSMTATRLGINNTPNLEEIENLANLSERVLQPVRNYWGPTRVLSGFRCFGLNKAIGGSTKSKHCLGQAADIECVKADNLEVFGWIADNLDFDQLILEFYTKGEPLSGWIHVSYNINENRNSILVASKDSGRTQYRKVNNISEV